jgi:hypothetical protein
MTNQNSKTIRKIGPASTTSILSPTRSCPPHSENGAGTLSESRIPHHASLLEPPSSQSPARDHQLSTTNHPATAPRKVSRNGKIARLSKPLRDLVNLMLQNNIPNPKIVGALDEHGIRVTARNVSNWKTRGGYEEWRIEHERALEKRIRQDNLTDYLRTHEATQLPEVGLQLAATQLSEFFLKPETEQQLATNPEKFARTISNLCRLTRHLHLLQKYRDDSARELGHESNPERVKRDIEDGLEITRHVYSAKKLGQTVHEPDIPHRNFLPKSDYPQISEYSR